jgi:hypothetical protein
MKPAEQLRLVRQLAFYDDLMRSLERHEIRRPRHQTPREFSESLSFLPIEAYHAIRRLTEIFYRVRFGHAQLDPEQNRRLARVVARVSGTLEQNPDTP